MKTELFGGRLTSSLAAFDLTKYDIAAGDPNPAHQGFSILVGEVRSTGLEYNLQGEVARNWNAILNFSLARPNVVQGASGAPLYGFNSAENIVTGMMLPGVPERTFSLWTSYRPPASAWKLGSGLNWASSETPAYGASLTAPAYWTTALFAAFDARIAGLATTLQLNVNNVFDRVYEIYFPEAASSNLANLAYGTPRQVKVSARAEF